MIEKRTIRTVISEQAFIEIDGCFWLATDIVAKELERIGIRDGADEVQMSLDGQLDDLLQNYVKKIKGKKYIKEYGVNYLLLSIAFETLESFNKKDLYRLCSCVEQSLGSLK